MSNTPSLLGCPFCGAPASGYPIEAHQHSSFLKNIVGVPDHGGSYVIEGNCACGSGLIGETEAEVTERWNRRTPQPAPVPAPLSEREAFESAWEKLHGRRPVLWSHMFACHKLKTPAHSEGKYFGTAEQSAWQMWQAQAAMAAQRGWDAG